MISARLALRRMIGVIQVIGITLVLSVVMYSVAEVAGKIAVMSVMGFSSPIIVIFQKNWIVAEDVRRFSFYLMLGLVIPLITFNLLSRLPSESILECFFALGAPVISYVVSDAWLFFANRMRLTSLKNAT